MTRTRYRFHEHDSPYFVTCTVVGWLPVFAFPPAAEIILASLEYLQNEKALCIHGYVIMENHIHLVISSPDPGRHLRRFKSYTARQIIDRLTESRHRWTLGLLQTYKRDYKAQLHQFWQEGSHPKQMLTMEMLQQKLEYVHNNPVQRGYVDHPKDWRYSSARNYLDRDGLIKVTRVL